MNKKVHVFLLIGIILFCSSCASKRKASDRYVVVISADGFRSDYVDLFKPPFLSSRAENGIRAEAMLPSFPSLTFPNHYSIVTGLYPSHHGLIGNKMYRRATGERYALHNAAAVRDSSWYGGLPLWSLARKHGIVSACYFWPGSEANIRGLRPHYYKSFNGKDPYENRLTQLKTWLNLPKKERPRLLFFYFSSPDVEGHRNGPATEPVRNGIMKVDSIVSAMQKVIESTPAKGKTDFIFLSDHGMNYIDKDNPIHIPSFLDSLSVPLFNGTIASLFLNDPSQSASIADRIRKVGDDRYKVYVKDSIPEQYHFGGKNDRFDRVGDILLVAQPPYYFGKNLTMKGGHGYFVGECPEMETTFIAWGPDFKSGKRIGKFENIHIYPLVAHLLGIVPDEKIDGDNRLIEETTIVEKNHQ